MAGYNKFDARLETLVMETRTLWDAEASALTDEERARIARFLHQHPAEAGQIEYLRMHTGFARHITVTADDIARVRQSASKSV